MHDEKLTDEERAGCTAHELAFVSMLSSADRHWQLSVAARRLAERAVDDWRRGFHTNGTLLEDDADADGRLAAIRASLLGDLTELAPGGLPLPALLGLGDATPEGWMVAVRQALLQADRGAPQARRRGQPRARTRIDSLTMAGNVLRLDRLAVARGLDAVHFGDGDGALLISAPAQWHREQGWRRPVPALGVQRPVLGRLTTEWTLVGSDVWCAATALVAALRAAPLMGLAPARLELVELELRSALGGLVAGVVTSDDAICAVVEELRSVGMLVRDEPLHEGVQALQWPHSHAALMHAIDRFAGPGGGAIGLPVEPGTWVEVVDPAAPGGERPAGWVVDPPVMEQNRTWAVRLGQDARGDESALFAYVRTAACDLRVPLAHLRRPRRISLFG